MTSLSRIVLALACVLAIATAPVFADAAIGPAFAIVGAGFILAVAGLIICLVLLIKTIRRRKKNRSQEDDEK